VNLLPFLLPVLRRTDIYPLKAIGCLKGPHIPSQQQLRPSPAVCKAIQGVFVCVGGRVLTSYVGVIAQAAVDLCLPGRPGHRLGGVPLEDLLAGQELAGGAATDQVGLRILAPPQLPQEIVGHLRSLQLPVLG